DMSRRIHPFKVWKRTNPSGKVSYAVIYDSIPHKRIASGKQTAEEAIAWAYQHMEDFTIRRDVPTFAEFTQNFFLIDKCKWSQR
ncbi:MAG: hypothetical protein ACXQTE_02815, partial [Methanosarcinaceae archaeon]